VHHEADTISHRLEVTQIGPDIDNLVVFGDSYSSTGNIYVATGGAFPAPSLFPSDGRWSNGPIWIDTLSYLLEIDSPHPSLLGGTNYAWGGATSFFEPVPGFTPPVGVQVLEYLDDVDGWIGREMKDLHVICGGGS
jgi:hypothetical protein